MANNGPPLVDTEPHSTHTPPETRNERLHREYEETRRYQIGKVNRKFAKAVASLGDEPEPLTEAESTRQGLALIGAYLTPDFLKVSKEIEHNKALIELGIDPPGWQTTEWDLLAHAVGLPPGTDHAKIVEMVKLYSLRKQIGIGHVPSPPAPERSGDNKRGKGGAKTIEESNPKLANLYANVMKEWKPGRKTQEIVDALLANADTKELAKELGKQIDAALIRAAKAHFGRKKSS